MVNKNINTGKKVEKMTIETVELKQLITDERVHKNPNKEVKRIKKWVWE